MRRGWGWLSEMWCVLSFGLPSHLLYVCLYQVEIGLLHDLGYAKSVATEPATSDDWEILVSALNPPRTRSCLREDMV